MSLEHWQQLPGGVTGWSAEFVFAHAAARSVAIPLTSGGVMVWNAGAEVPPDARQELADQGGVKGLVLRALGSAPGFRLSHAFKHHALASRPDYRGWLFDRLADGGPTILVPAHGDRLAGPRLAADIRRLVEKRL